VDDAGDVHLGPLREDEARELFGRVMGDGVDLPTALVDRVVQACSRMPLAVRVAAARLRRAMRVAVRDERQERLLSSPVH
jgi:hypothetical protein